MSDRENERLKEILDQRLPQNNESLIVSSEPKRDLLISDGDQAFPQNKGGLIISSEPKPELLISDGARKRRLMQLDSDLNYIWAFYVLFFLGLMSLALPLLTLAMGNTASIANGIWVMWAGLAFTLVSGYQLRWLNMVKRSIASAQPRRAAITITKIGRSPAYAEIDGQFFRISSSHVSWSSTQLEADVYLGGVNQLPVAIYVADRFILLSDPKGMDNPAILFNPLRVLSSLLSTKSWCCSFCGKAQKSVAKLIPGPGVNICDECVEKCNNIVHLHRKPGLKNDSDEHKS